MGKNCNIDKLIEQLISRNIFKLDDGRDLWQGSEEELKALLRRVVRLNASNGKQCI
jgi:hypothetical protein